MGREIKRNIKRSPRAYGEEPGGLNSLPAGSGDEKADSWQLRVLEPSSSAHPPLIRLGSQRRGAVRGWLYLLIGRGKDTPRLRWSPPQAAGRALLLVTEVLPPPAEGSRTARHYQLLPEGAGSLHSPKPFPLPSSGGVASLPRSDLLVSAVTSSAAP